MLLVHSISIICNCGVLYMCRTWYVIATTNASYICIIALRTSDKGNKEWSKWTQCGCGRWIHGDCTNTKGNESLECVYVA